MNNSSENLSKSIKIALLGAIGAILMFMELPIIPLFPWLKLDFSELPVLLGAFGFGPIAGVIIEIIKLVIRTIYTGTTTGYVGELANFIMGIAFVLPAAFIYHRRKSKKTAIVGMVVGTLIMEVVAILTNIYVLLPLYGMPMVGGEALKYVALGLIPLNTIKAVSVSFLTYFLYKKLSVALFKVDPKLEIRKKIQE
ncbi:MAG: ECF transporter S component [Clostridiales bacterium]|nr:ECF transporter S component [Clostridiales bacterium]